ncbi:MAG: lasso peptide biosynthesis B2 protein [Arenicella sp.]|nr:lasso peptide biosynthesis B2 protein [Arenicella sp.]
MLQLGWLWCAYWRLWPVLLRIKFKQFFNDNRWLALKLTVVQSRPTNRIADSSLAAQMHESVRLAARLQFLVAECLPKSIVLVEMLIARGVQASVVIGVSKKGGQFSSHAWVEVDGKMVAEPESVRDDFTQIDGY